MFSVTWKEMVKYNPPFLISSSQLSVLFQFQTLQSVQSLLHDGERQTLNIITSQDRLGCPENWFKTSGNKNNISRYWFDIL